MIGMKRKDRKRIAHIAAIAGTLGLSAGSRAEVMEIAPDGTVAILSGGAAFQRNRHAPDDAPPDAGIPDAMVPDAAAITLHMPAAPAAWREALARIAAANDLSPDLLEALIWQESRWRADAVSPAGAIGLAQLMPATARALGVDPRDPIANMTGGARYLRQQLDLFDGDLEKALAAYNAGPARVLRADGIPAIAETRAYVTAIIGRLSAAPQAFPVSQGE